MYTLSEISLTTLSLIRKQWHTDLLPLTDFLYSPHFSVDTSVCDYDVGTAAVVQEGNATRATETQYRNVRGEEWIKRMLESTSEGLES